MWSRRATLLATEIGRVQQSGCSLHAMPCLVAGACTHAPVWQRSRASCGRMPQTKTCYPRKIGITFLRRGPKFGQPPSRQSVEPMQQIADWLEKLGLGQYALRFAENGIDLSVLPELTDQDFDRLGVLLGHRRKMLRVSAELNQAELVAEPARRHDAERRHLTVMFCDLVGSTALSARFDPEDLQELLRTYFARVDDVAGSHGGFVAKYLGDGALIYFGYPQAHEDDAERAVRAGLALVDGISELTAAGERLSARVGIATGLVVI